jgi:sulfatase modifying factor 1
LTSTLPNWFSLAVVGLLGCNAVLGLDQRTLSPDASGSGSGSASGNGDAIADVATEGGEVPDSAAADETGEMDEAGESGTGLDATSGSGMDVDSSEDGMGMVTASDAPTEAIPSDGSDASEGGSACLDGQGRCLKSIPQMCTSGAWVSAPAACSGADPVCLNGACVACSPTTTQCSENGIETCGSSGQWGAAVPCASSQTCLNATSGATCVTIPSCLTSAAGLSSCGPTGESCCASLEVPGGSYYRTYATMGTGTKGQADPATISGFRLDKYLVTVGRFRQFVTAWNNGAGYTPPAASGKHTYLNNGNGLNATGGGYEPGWVTSDNGNVVPTNANLACDQPYQTWTNTAGSHETLPMNCLNWYEAYAFCIWDGGFLPSEAEWEYAAAGGSEQLEYPWGSTAPGMACPGPGCQYAITNCDYPNGSGNCVGATNIAPVGTASLGVGFWGQFDLAGEVFEWGLDWYATYADPCTDCANLTAGGEAAERVMRGGYFGRDPTDLLPANRNDESPASRDGHFGVRCARSP